GTRWFEPSVSQSDAAAWHPTHVGMSGISALLLHQIQSPSATPAHSSYVALGDSYTAGPSIEPVRARAPMICGRSAANYPSLVAAELGADLTDASCSGAVTANLTNLPQGANPPQIGKVLPTTSLVTVSIGGNDENIFSTLMTECSAANRLPHLRSDPCQ